MLLCNILSYRKIHFSQMKFKTRFTDLLAQMVKFLPNFARSSENPEFLSNRPIFFVTKAPQTDSRQVQQQKSAPWGALAKSDGSCR
jgi:hypothetical protein